MASNTIAQQYQALTTPKYEGTTISALDKTIKPLDYLIFANNAYQDKNTMIDLPLGWEGPIKEKHKWFSGYDGVVFINHATKRIVVAHRGTDENIDFASYPAIATGEVGKQIKAAEKLTNSIMKKYPEYTVSHTGHSLGGYITEVLSATQKTEGVSFDSPGGGRTIYKQGKDFDTSKITAYVSDPNIVNSVRYLPFGEVGTVFKINQGNTTQSGNWHNTETHGIYDYMKQFFDTKTGQLRKDCFKQSSAEKIAPNAGKDISYTYKPNISKNKATQQAEVEGKLLDSSNQTSCSVDNLTKGSEMFCTKQ